MRKVLIISIFLSISVINVNVNAGEERGNPIIEEVELKGWKEILNVPLWDIETASHQIERKEVFLVGGMLAVGILTISTISFLCYVDKRLLIVFYALILLSAIICVVAEALVGGWGLFVGMLVGGMLGLVPALLIGKNIKWFEADELAVGLMGAFVGVFVVVLAGELAKGGTRNFLYFLTFIITIEILSFVIAYIAQKIRLRLTVSSN